MRTTPHIAGGIHPGAPSLPANIICFLEGNFSEGMQPVIECLQHLETQFNILFIEKPVRDANSKACFSYQAENDHMHILTPHLPTGISNEASSGLLKDILNGFLGAKDMSDFIFWYVDPTAATYSSHLKPAVTIYHCTDERLSDSADVQQLHKQLLDKADVVFTTSHTLYLHEKAEHANLHLLHTGIDTAHFTKARGNVAEAEEQAAIPYPRIGCMGPIDDRFDSGLIAAIAAHRPDWHIVIAGPVHAADALLPHAANIHYLNNASYEALPSYITGWNITAIPHKNNKPDCSLASLIAAESLAAGVPVVATPLAEVETEYHDTGLITTAATADEFIKAAESILFGNAADREWLRHADDFLVPYAWDNIVADILSKIQETTNQHNYINQVA